MSKKSKDNSTRLGYYITANVSGESYRAFLPPNLPPEPPIDMTSLQGLLLKAGKAIARLDSAAELMPDINLMLYYYIRKEAVLSSQIEGTQSSLSDLLLYESYETPAVPLGDVIEVSTYIAALQHGLRRMEGGFPLSLRLIREMHEILLSHGRGSNKQPGEFRRSQNWIGGSRPGNAVFVPPPPERLNEFLHAFELYFHEENHIYPSLINAGLIHVQFETIHPFLDGNGRIGRLLITLYLIMKGDMKQPLLYLSLFFKNNRSEYYHRLIAIRKNGDWEGWLAFFLTGVAETADQVLETSKKIGHLFIADLKTIVTLKRAGIRARNTHDVLRNKAIISATEVAKQLQITVQTARASLFDLKKLGIVHDIAGEGKERLYVYTNLISILEEGTIPINF